MSEFLTLLEQRERALRLRAFCESPDETALVDAYLASLARALRESKDEAAFAAEKDGEE